MYGKIQELSFIILEFTREYNKSILIKKLKQPVSKNHSIYVSISQSFHITTIIYIGTKKIH